MFSIISVLLSKHAFISRIKNSIVWAKSNAKIRISQNIIKYTVIFKLVIHNWRSSTNNTHLWQYLKLFYCVIVTKVINPISNLCSNLFKFYFQKIFLGYFQSVKEQTRFRPRKQKNSDKVLVTTKNNFVCEKILNWFVVILEFLDSA